MFANCQLMGLDLAFPDICKTPPAMLPIPYPNLALGLMAIPNAWNILMMCMPAHNMATTIPLTNGDNAGVELGLASPTVMGPSRHVTCVPTVLVKCIPATRMTCTSTQNRTNAVGMRIVPSQIKVVLLGGGGGSSAAKSGSKSAGNAAKGAKNASTKAAKRARLKANHAKGKLREKEVEAELREEGHEILGTQVSAKTPLSRRVIDILIRDGETNEVRAIEVKAGNAVRSSTQVAKDEAMASEGATLVGKNAPTGEEFEGILKIVTEVLH